MDYSGTFSIAKVQRVSWCWTPPYFLSQAGPNWGGGHFS